MEIKGIKTRKDVRGGKLGKRKNGRRKENDKSSPSHSNRL